MKEKQEKDEHISFALRERSTMSANWTGTKAVPRATSIESQLSVDAEPLSLNLTACSEDCITSVQEGSGQTGWFTFLVSKYYTCKYKGDMIRFNLATEIMLRSFDENCFWRFVIHINILCDLT